VAEATIGADKGLATGIVSTEASLDQLVIGDIPGAGSVATGAITAGLTTIYVAQNHNIIAIFVHIQLGDALTLHACDMDLIAEDALNGDAVQRERHSHPPRSRAAPVLSTVDRVFPGEEAAILDHIPQPLFDHAENEDRQKRPADRLGGRWPPQELVAIEPGQALPSVAEPASPWPAAPLG
jgi:hypothetical protein